MAETPVETGRSAGWAPIDMVLVAGFAIAVWSASIDLTVVGIDDLPPTDPVMELVQRLSVYVPLALALLARVPIRSALVRPAAAIFTLFVAWAIVAALFADEPGAEVERALWFGGFVLLTLAVYARAGWRSFLWVLAGVALPLVVGGLVAHGGGWAASDRTEFFDGGLFGYERVRGLQPTANSLGRASGFLALAGTILTVHSDRWATRLVAATTALIGLGGVLASQSRFSLLGLTVGVAIVGCQRWRWLRVPAVLALAAGTAVGLFVMWTGSLGPFARASEANEIETVLGRTQVWEESIDLAVGEPLWGIGTEGMLEHFDRLQSGGYAFWDPENGHNVVFHTAAAHGVLAAALVLAALTVGLLLAWTRGAPGTAAVLAMFAAIGVVEALLIGSPTIAIAALVAALAASSARPPEPA